MHLFHGLYAKRYFVDDAAEAIAGANAAEEFGTLRLGSFGQISGGSDPFDLGNVRANLTELHAVERVFGMAAGGRTDGHVADFDIQHELEVLRAECVIGVDHLQSRLSGESLVLWIDGNDLGHLGHAQDGAAVGRGAGRQGVIATHGAHRTGIAPRITQHSLDLFHCFRIDELLRRRGNTAVVIDDCVGHAIRPLRRMSLQNESQYTTRAIQRY